jgi:hypothetical protein
MIDHIGDILAIPFFAWLSHYFYSIPNRTHEQTVLLVFSLGGLLADMLFTTRFLHNLRMSQAYIAALVYFLLIFILFQFIFVCSKTPQKCVYHPYTPPI